MCIYVLIVKGLRKLYIHGIRAIQSYTGTRFEYVCLRAVAVSKIKGKCPGYTMEIYFVIMLELGSRT